MLPVVIFWNFLKTPLIFILCVNKLSLKRRSLIYLIKKCLCIVLSLLICSFYCIILSFWCNSPLSLILHTFFVFAVSLAPPPPSILQVTPQLPLMGFVARVQENSKFMSSLCCRSDYRHKMSFIYDWLNSHSLIL